jgi:RNA 2',3'-cyclic 3'-phosphodiesterase
MTCKRIFIGTTLSEEWHKFFNEFKSLQQADDRIKWVQPENLHVTFLFIGSMEECLIPLVANNLQIVAEENTGFQLQFRQFVFKPSKKPTMIWVEFLKTPPFEELSIRIFKSVAEVFIANGKQVSFELHKELIPHCTLARIKKFTYDSSPQLKTAELNIPEQFIVEDITIFESVQSEKGARYKILYSFSL